MTKLEFVDGIFYDYEGMKRCEITVRVTVDEKGASISFSDDRKVMLHVPVEPIRSLLEFAIGGVKNEC